MLKTISAALLAVSVLAAPALAAGSAKTTPAPTAKAAQMKSGALNANAKMKHHVRHVRRHVSNKKLGALKAHHVSKVAIKHAAPTTKRG